VRSGIDEKQNRLGHEVWERDSSTLQPEGQKNARPAAEIAPARDDVATFKDSVTMVKAPLPEPSRYERIDYKALTACKFAPP
jgi:hypothetical protein